MIRDLFEQEGQGRQVAHEYASRAFAKAAVIAAEEGEAAGCAMAQALIQDCPYDAIVGNAYAPWLPLFAELCGPELVFVHLRRRDRSACVRSLTENATYFPTAYGYYSSAPEAVETRPAAFHYGEMSRQAWDALPLSEKLGWYYDRTHELLDRHAGLFADRHELKTEELNSTVTRALIGALVSLDGLSARATHLNAHTAMAETSPERRYKMQWLMGRFDLSHAAEDDVYALDYFTNAFAAWTGYQIRRSEHIGPDDYRSGPELQVTLDRAAAILDWTSHLVRLLQAELADAGERLKPD